MVNFMKKIDKKSKDTLHFLLNAEETDIGIVATVDMLGEEAKQILLNIGTGKSRGFTSQERSRAIYLLGLLRWEKATTSITQLIASKNQSIRIHSLYALGLIGSRAATKSLLSNMKSPNIGQIEKGHILNILGEIGDKEIEKEIRDFVSNEKDVSLKLEANEALSNIELNNNT